MGEDTRETPGATRSQHIVLHGPADGRTMAAALRPGVERSREIHGNASPACLVITPTVEQAIAAAEQARTLLGEDAGRVVPVSAVARAKRVLESGPVAIVAGTVHDLLELRRGAAVNLESLKAVVLVGLDELLADGVDGTLQALLADAPADAMRIATLDADSPATDAFIEAHLRRARRVAPLVPGDGSYAVTPRYAVTNVAGRPELLRAVLDELDPPSVVIVAATEAGEFDARRALTRLGVTINGESVHVTRHAPSGHAALVLLWEAPAGAEALTEAVAARPVDAIAFLQPDEVPSFHRLTAGAAQPWTSTARKEVAENRTRALRTAVKSTLSNGGATASELALLAPLLESHDAMEIAAAALRLYEGARRDAQALRAKVTHAVPSAPARAASGASTRGSLALVGRSGATALTGKQRVFLAVGKRDGVRVGDIVGAVANEAGIDGGRIGSVELFESHTTVELDGPDAARVVETMGNTTLRGRPLGARIDERGSSAGAYGAPRGRGDRPERAPRSGGADRGERPSRSASSSGERSARPARKSFGAERPERSERPDRPHRSEKPDRSSAERSAPRGAARGPSRDGPPARGGSANRGAPRASEVRRAFNDRPIRERTESTGEWSERGERMKHAKRAPRQSPSGRNDEE